MQSELEGIGKLRKGVLILIIAPILIIGALILAGFTLATTLISTLSSLSKMTSVSTLSKNPASIISALSSSISRILSPHFTLMTLVIGIIGFVSFILVIVGYSYVRKGFKTLSVGVGHAGTTLFFSFLVLFILGILILVGIGIGATKIASISPEIAHSIFIAGIYGSVVLVGIGLLLLFISNILLGIGFYRVGSKYNESVSKVGGIFILLTGILDLLLILLPMTISEVTPFLYFLGIILVYAGLMRISPVQQTQQLPIQQPAVQQPQPLQQPRQEQTVQQLPLVQQAPTQQPVAGERQPPSITQTQQVQAEQAPIQQSVQTVSTEQQIQQEQTRQIPIQLTAPTVTIEPKSQTPQLTPQSLSQTTPQIYQMGQGVIRSDGIAYLIIYSTTQVLILSARIEGTNINSTNIIPAALIPGQNGVVIKFDNVSSLKPGSTYIIAITINVGGSTSEIKAVAVYQP